MVKIPSSNTVPHVSVTDGQLTTTSRDIAITFGKRHDHILERIAKLDCSPDFSAPNFRVAEYIDAQGKPRTEYRITRDGFSFLCMGFTGAKAAQWKERYISTFNQMAEQLANPVPSLQFRRFLMWYDENGVEQVKNVPIDSFVGNWDFVTRMIEAGDIPKEAVLKIANAAGMQLIHKAMQGAPSTAHGGINKLVNADLSQTDLNMVVTHVCLEQWRRAAAVQQERLAVGL